MQSCLRYLNIIVQCSTVNMKRQWMYLYMCLIASFFHSTYGRATPDSSTYRAAVVEYNTVSVKNNGGETIQRNTAKYVRLINQAAKQDVDIIVFPEDGITSDALPARAQMNTWSTIIPSAADNYNPCVEDTVPVADVLKTISCAARNNSIYVGINIAEKSPCTGTACPPDNIYYYNSNVVFDPLGKIIARYRKTNLFLEGQFNKLETADITTFDTNFGVKFGIFTCFDILFAKPALNLTRHERVKDIIYPTAWFSELPFLTAVQTQMGWSYGEDVNLLASGYNNPKVGHSGSGIYLGRHGIAKALLPLSDHEEMLIADVPKKNHMQTCRKRSIETTPVHSLFYPEQSYKHIELKKTWATVNELKLLHESLEPYETVSVSGNTTQTVCHNTFCCNFDIVMENVDPTTPYRLGVFNGRRMFVHTYPAGIKACAIVQCANETAASCGSAKPSESTFKSIDITSRFDDYDNTLIMPSTLREELLPLNNFTYDEHKNENYVDVSMSFTGSQSNLYTFGIYARVFSRD